MKELKVSDVMTCLVVKLYPSDSIHEAATRLAQNNISGAPVVEDGKVVGIVSEADLMRAAIPPARVDRGSTMNLIGLVLRGHLSNSLQDTQVSSVMSGGVIVIRPNSSIWDAARTMERYGVKRLPVTDEEDNLVGIISRADLVAVMARTDQELQKDVVETIGILGEESIEGVHVQIEGAVATLRGRADRRSTKDLAVKLASRVPGIVEVVDRLDFDWDDAKRIPGPKDPWAVGPLVKGA